MDNDYFNPLQIRTLYYASNFIEYLTIFICVCSELLTAKNTATSSNFLLWKFCGKAQFPHSFGGIRPKLCGKCVFPQNFHARKLGEITIFSL